MLPAEVAEFNQASQSGVRVLQTLSVDSVIIILAGHPTLVMRITTQNTNSLLREQHLAHLSIYQYSRRNSNYIFRFS